MTQQPVDLPHIIYNSIYHYVNFLTTLLIFPHLITDLYKNHMIPTSKNDIFLDPSITKCYSVSKANKKAGELRSAKRGERVAKGD